LKKLIFSKPQAKRKNKINSWRQCGLGRTTGGRRRECEEERLEKGSSSRALHSTTLSNNSTYQITSRIWVPDCTPACAVSLLSALLEQNN